MMGEEGAAEGMEADGEWIWPICDIFGGKCHHQTHRLRLPLILPVSPSFPTTVPSLLPVFFCGSYEHLRKSIQ